MTKLSVGRNMVKKTTSINVHRRCKALTPEAARTPPKHQMPGNDKTQKSSQIRSFETMTNFKLSSQLPQDNY
jgi:hypothetical protein